MNKILMVAVIVVPFVVFMVVFGPSMINEGSQVFELSQNAGIIALVSALGFVCWYAFLSFIQVAESRVLLAVATTVDENPGLKTDDVIARAKSRFHAPFFYNGYFSSTLERLYVNGKIVLVEGKWYPAELSTSAENVFPTREESTTSKRSHQLEHGNKK